MAKSKNSLGGEGSFATASVEINFNLTFTNFCESNMACEKKFPLFVKNHGIASRIVTLYPL